MKTIIRKTVSLFLVLLLCFFLFTPAVAAGKIAYIIVHTYSDADKQHRLTPFVIYDGAVYIKAEDALALSGYDTYSEDYGKVIFKYGHHSVEYKDGQLDLAGVFYYPLQNLMDALSTAYHYDETSETLIFVTCTSYFENLLVDCEAIFNDGYELTFLEGTGWQVAGVYEIVAGVRVDSLWGGYQIELYEDTITGILAIDDSELTATLKQGSSIMSKLSKLLAFSQIDINGLEAYADFLGTDLDGIVEAYSILNGLVPGIDVNDAIEILDYVYSSTESATVFPNAVKYGLVDNQYIMDQNLNYAADRIYSLYDENKETLDIVLTNFLNDVIRGAIGELGEEAAKTIGEDITLSFIEGLMGREYGRVFINTTYVKLAKLVFDELGMKERSTAVMQTVAARNIQHAAKLQYELSNGKTRYIIYDDYSLESQSGPDPIRTKYSTILYLRACQYAYSLYEFDSDLSYWSNIWCEKTTAAMDTILAYSDDELTRTVGNEPVPVEKLKTFDIAENQSYDFIPISIQVKEWSAGPDEYCPNIIFNEDMTCDITFNLAEWMQNCTATYKLLISENGNKTIKIDLESTIISDGKAHESNWFCLVERDDDTWEYYGEGIGLTKPGTIFESETEIQFPVVAEAILLKIDDIIGEYGWVDGVIFDILTVGPTENNAISFNVEWYRAASIVGATGVIYGNLIPFSYAYYNADFNEYFYETMGVLEFVGKTVVLTLFETNLPFIDIGSYTYVKNVQTESE